MARDIWAALSRTALDSGFSGVTARWERLRKLEAFPGHEDSSLCLFVVGQDRPEAMEYVGSPGPPAHLLYGVVVATPERSSPLSGSLLYQGVGRLTDGGVRGGALLPALVPVSPKTEGVAYAEQLFIRLQEVRARR